MRGTPDEARRDSEYWKTGTTMNKTANAFAGAYCDAVTHAYPLGAGYRWYLPPLMRFGAPDERSPFGAGGINPYAYCGADPVNRIDPSGRSWLSLLARGIAAKVVREGTHEAASSLAPEEAQAASEQSIESGTTSIAPDARERADSSSSTHSEFADRPSALSLDSFDSPSNSRPQTPLPHEISQWMAKQREAVSAVESEAGRALARRSKRLRAIQRERAATGRAYPPTAQRFAQPLRVLAEKASVVNRELGDFAQTLDRYGDRFGNQLDEIRTLQQSASRIAIESSAALQGLGQVQVDTLRVGQAFPTVSDPN
ncbi:RHS repeat-associated core domain-containing protein [Trinickia sp. NRRL B-1857]|uniref:RHS repeat-associated core domain-containing protein n=1 Tax=Trinickia sp. NRRL B-1857 TaxID=3162879 RepID=UPI003D288F1E